MDLQILNSILNTNYSTTDEFIGNTDFKFISTYNDLTDEQIIELKDYLDWAQICTNQVMSEETLETCIDKLDWTNLSYHHPLSMNFITNHKDKLNLKSISKQQELTTEFINSNFSILCPTCLNMNQQIPQQTKITLNITGCTNCATCPKDGSCHR